MLGTIRSILIKSHWDELREECLIKLDNLDISFEYHRGNCAESSDVVGAIKAVMMLDREWVRSMFGLAHFHTNYMNDERRLVHFRRSPYAAHKTQPSLLVDFKVYAVLSDHSTGNQWTRTTAALEDRIEIPYNSPSSHESNDNTNLIMDLIESGKIITLSLEKDIEVGTVAS